MVWADPRSSCPQRVRKAIHQSGTMAKRGTQAVRALLDTGTRLPILPVPTEGGVWRVRVATATLGEEPFRLSHCVVVASTCDCATRLDFTVPVSVTRGFHFQDRLPTKAHLPVQSHHPDGAITSVCLTRSDKRAPTLLRKTPTGHPHAPAGPHGLHS